jgi:hypothetical protein
LSRRSRLRISTLGLATAIGVLLAVSAQGEVVQKDGLIVSFGGSIAPHLLPRTGRAPVGVTVSGRIRDAGGGLPPSLRRISLEINRNGILSDRGLPACPLRRLQPSSTREALEACGNARVGGGRVDGQIVIPGQRPVRYDGRVVAFNGQLPNGHAAILVHLYSGSPLPLTFVLAFSIERTPGRFGTRLVAVVPQRTRRLIHVTGFTLHLQRTYEFGGERRSYLRAGCPAPEGFPGVTFPLVRTSYRFDGAPTLSSTLVRTCHAQ